MKKRTAFLAALLLMAALAASALAAGSSGDPLATLSYLTGVFTQSVDRQVDARLDESDALISGAAGTDAAPATWTEQRYKAGDTLTAGTGAGLLVLAGEARVDHFGAVVDVTTGAAVPSGAALAPNHRYLVAEDTSAAFTVTSKTAVISTQGPASLQVSGATDYNAIAAALKTMHLFQGSFTGYGEGFDLEAAPTRLQALIMFIRVLGEEQQALAWSGTTPFTDLTPGSQGEKYVGYAYARGYTNGYSATTFRPGQTVNASQYVEFVLRALGYSSADNKNLSGTLDNALANSVLTWGEVEDLRNSPFLRADLAYVSYYALDAFVAGSGRTLRDTLLDNGTFTAAESAQAQTMVPSARK